jgi:hypothetical protein
MAQAPDTVIWGSDMPYSTPPTFIDGEYLGAYKLRLLAANDDHFNGVADELQMIQRTPGGGSINGADGPMAVFDGYLYLTQNTIRYGLYLDEAGTGTKVRLYFDYGGAGQALIRESIATGLYEATFDATAFTKNALYRVYADIYNYGGGSAGSAYVQYFHEVFTGTDTYAAPDAFDDTHTSVVADFTTLSVNDALFNEITPDNFPFWAVPNLSLGTWTGYVKHSEKRRKLYYRVTKTTNDVVIAYGGTTVATVAAAGVTESSLTLDPATWTEGTWYAVTVTGAGGGVSYLATGAAALSAGYNPLGEFMPGTFVYGTTANQRTRLALLSSNDADIAARLKRTNYVRANWAVKKNLYPILGENVVATYVIMHSKPILYYRGTNIQMTWGTANSQSLNTLDGSHPYWTLDLSVLQNLMIGQTYTISGDSVEWACERAA